MDVSGAWRSGSARGLGPRGRRFEPGRPDQDTHIDLVTVLLTRITYSANLTFISSEGRGIYDNEYIRYRDK